MYFDTLLGFVSGNCGNFVVPKIVMRVTSPVWEGLFDITSESAFFTDFLVRIPRGVEIRIYPYMHKELAVRRWADYSKRGHPLEGVFMYAHNWNKLLSKLGLPARISGVVVDGEERDGFDREQPNVARYKKKYHIHRFAVAIGFDAHRHRDFYPAADEFYMEMYDFYDVNRPVKPAIPVETSPADNPHTFLEKAHALSLFPFIETYNDPRMHFMWSVQARSKPDCIFPLNGTCGSKDDFGWFSAGEFNTFLGLVEDRYPELQGRSHGIFQFSFVPPSWL